MTNSTDQLKPCPFCNSGEVTFSTRDASVDPYGAVWCRACGAYGPSGDMSKVVPLWNTRHAQEGEAVAFDLSEAVTAFQLAELSYGEKMEKSGLLFDPALGVEAGLIAALPYLHPPRSDDEADAANLKQFAHEIFRATDWPDGGDLDGFEFQEIAVKCGLLEEVEMKEPCGEVCHCYDMGADFPARCFRKTSLYYTCAAMAARGGEKAA